MTERSSRIKGLYQQTISQRQDTIAAWADFDASDRATLDGGLDLASADALVENAIGLFSLPLAVAPNFIINGREMIVPLVIEEPSVVAAMANAARLARSGGGFQTGSTEPIMIGQIQLLDVPNPAAAAARILDEKEALLAQIADLHPTIRRLGGGPRDLQVRFLNDTPAGAMLIVHLLMDTRDAMGANAINTACEALAPALEALSGGRRPAAHSFQSQRPTCGLGRMPHPGQRLRQRRVRRSRSRSGHMRSQRLRPRRSLSRRHA